MCDKFTIYSLPNISERKLADDALDLAATAFKTQIGIIVTDSNKIIQKVNAAFTLITGYSAEEIIGQTPSFLHSEVHNGSFYQAMWSSINRQGSWSGEIWDMRRNGQPLPVWLTITAIKNNEGNITHYVGSFTDLTLQKKKQKKLLDSKHELESKIASTQDKVKQFSKESNDARVALDVLLEQLRTTMTNAQSQLSVELEKTVMPFLKTIRKLSNDKKQIQLIEIVESNLKHLIQSYGRSTSLKSIYQKLTPSEIQVAAMVRQGLPTKTIASALNLSPGTINIHRKKIRKKIGLVGKATNLASYLQSFSEENN